MNMKAIFYGLIAAAVFLTGGLSPAAAQESKKFKVLAVFSYDEAYSWVGDIREGIESVFLSFPSPGLGTHLPGRLPGFP